MGSDRFRPVPQVQLTHPEWTRAATLYQINTRQFTPEGTFAAAEAHLPRLAELGVSILWVMPVQTIGEVNRKGSLGSPYAVRDYYEVNPEFGTMADFRHFVDAAHGLGLKVILDWVANHTAWDNELVRRHPEWYARDWKGDFCPTPWWDWDDIIDLDYSHQGLREYMGAAMAHWVREADLDGFRCDVAGHVPTDFWEAVRQELEEIKAVFLLAEWEQRDLHTRAFDATYAWSWNEAMHDVAMGRKDANALRVFYAWNDRSWPWDIMRMMFTTNHDHNSWEGTEYARFGEMLESATVLSFVGEGMPLIYNGQEAGNERQLAFFERDPITWQEHPMNERYRRLVELKTDTSCLWNAGWGARMVNVTNSAESQVISFTRSDKASAVFGVFNLSDEARTITFGDGPHHGEWTDFASGSAVSVDADWSVDIPAWGHRVLTR